MLEEWSPAMLPHGRHSLFQPPMQLRDQASAHGLPPLPSGGEVRYRSLDPITTILGNYTKSLGKPLRNRQAWQSWMSPSLSGQGGDPTFTSLGFKSPSDCFGEKKGMTKELELGYMIQNIHEHMKAKTCKSKLRKGIKREDPRGELSNQLAQTKQQTKEEKQLDQARLLAGQLMRDLSKKEFQRMQLQQNDKIGTRNNNSLGTTGSTTVSTSSLGTVSNNDLGANSLEEQTLGDKSLGCEEQQHSKNLEPETLAPRSPIKLWKILIDTGAEISVAPRSFAEDVQLSPLTHNFELRNADGRAINIFGLRTVPLLTQRFSFCITFAIADVEQPLLGLGSLLNSNLSLQLDKNLGHHLSNNLGERIKLEQRGLQLYLSACLAKLGFHLPNKGNLLNNSSLLPDANLGPSNLQLEKEVCKTGGVESLPPRSLEQHRIQKNKPTIGQQQQALPKAKAKHKKKSQRKVATKLSNWEKNDYMEKLQLELLEKQDPRASLDQNTGKHLSLRIIVILSLMNKWQLKTLRPNQLGHKSSPKQNLGSLESKSRG